MGRPIYHLRDLVHRLSAYRVGEKVDLQAIIIDRNKRGNFIFLSVQDETDNTQVIFKRIDVSAGAWEVAVGLRAGDSVRISGLSTRDFLDSAPQKGVPNRTIQTAATIIGEDVRKLASAKPTLDRGGRTVGLSSPVTQVFLSRLKNQLLEELHKAEPDLDEIDTRLVTSQPPKPGGAYPLKVHYDGYGAPFYIVPSPVPQLIQLLATTPRKGAFCVSRCFTQGYRDPIVSVESLIVSIACRGRTVGDLLLSADRMFRSLLENDPIERKKLVPNAPKPKIVRHEQFDSKADAAVLQPEVQLFRTPEMQPSAFEIGRLCWPPLSKATADFQEYVIAEGHTAGTPQNTAYAVMTINIDRLLTIVFEQIDLRRIPNLPGTEDLGVS